MLPITINRGKGGWRRGRTGHGEVVGEAVAGAAGEAEAGLEGLRAHGGREEGPQGAAVPPVGDGAPVHHLAWPGEGAAVRTPLDPGFLSPDLNGLKIGVFNPQQ